MSVIISKIQKQGKLIPGEIVSQYLGLLPDIFSEKKGENFVFLNRTGCLGMVFEGKIPKKVTSEFVSRTIRIAGRSFAIVKYSLMNDRKFIEKLSLEIDKNLFISSSFVLMEHTAKWEIYKGQKWLDDYAPPRFTPKNNVYLPQGTIGPYFGYGKDERGFYKKEKRGIDFAKTIGTEAKHYPLIVSQYYGKFLDSENLSGLVKKEQTGLAHFTVGIYKKNKRPKLFCVKSETIGGSHSVLETKNFLIICSYKPIALLLKNKVCKSGSLKAFSPGKILEFAL